MKNLYEIRDSSFPYAVSGIKKFAITQMFLQIYDALTDMQMT